MLQNSNELIADFVHIAAISGASMPEHEIVHERLLAPHRVKPLPRGKQAVYVFSMSVSPYLVLKVGKVGPNSNARFQSQHYIPSSSQSNLAKSLLNRQAVWSQLGLVTLTELESGDWIKAHMDRDHFFIAAEQGPFVLSLLEAFLQCRLRPMFEG